jgi:pyridoxamine 5'-phosphate oxidase
MDKLRDIRSEYEESSLEEDNVNKDPLLQFEKWFAEALLTNMKHPNAFILSTSTKKGKPSARVVLLKGIDPEGFVFYTNYESRKANEITENSFASMTFFWPKMERQIRIEGSVKKVSTVESDEYFSSRPRGSQAGAWVSPQSKIIPGRDALDVSHDWFLKENASKEITRPPFWGGYRIYPAVIEFWQGRTNRLHDRILYTFENEEWKIERLAP